MKRTLFSPDEAKVLGNHFLLHPLVQKVEIFGSLSRNVLGHDFDMILIVSKETSNLFFQYSLRKINFFKKLKKIFPPARFFMLGHSYSRQKACEKLLGKKFMKKAERIVGEKYKIDLFLLPSNYREDPGKYQSKLPHINPKFMENLANDAKTLC